jgi:hypothetical protein
MKKVHDLLSERRCFVGRKDELALMADHLSRKNESWGILHVHGPAGMGKTALLQQFALMNGSIPSIYVKANPAFADPEQFEQAVRRRLAQLAVGEDGPSAGMSLADTLNHVAGKHGGLMLLLDGLSEWTDIGYWLREEWLLTLSTDILVFSAGRQPLISWQTLDSWAHLIRNIPLGPLPKADWIRYAAAHGITDLKTIDLIGRVSEGVPLAINLVCQDIRSRGGKWRPETDKRSLLDMFDRVILHPDNLSGVNRLLLDLASLVYTFDHEMLEYILGETIPTAEFQLLCQSSFVRVNPEGGWTVSNGIRRWAKEGLKRRSPEAYAQYKLRAEQILERRTAAAASSANEVQQEMRSGKMFLHDNDIIHGYIYYDVGLHLAGRPARREDIPLLREMYLKHIVAYPENLPDTSHQEQYLTDVWNVDPSVIHVFEDEGRLAGFYAALPLDDPRFRELLDRNPATRAFSACTPPEPCDWLYWLIASDPPLDQGFAGQVLRDMLQNKLPGNRITMMMPSVEFTEAAKLVGFREVPEAFCPSDDGCSFYFFQLDARQRTAGNPDPKEASEMWMEIAKTLLASFKQLELREPVLHQCQRIWGTHYSLSQLVRYVQNTIISEWRRLEHGSPKERKMARILYYAYMQKIGTHEVVAERLGLPSSTYYRYLSKLIREIARALQYYRGV